MRPARVRLSAYTGGDLDLSTAEGAYYGRMQAQRESAVKSARVREAQDREARKGRRIGGGSGDSGIPHLRRSGRAEPQEAAHRAGRKSTRSRRTRSGTRPCGY